jgi:hypothetical protein
MEENKQTIDEQGIDISLPQNTWNSEFKEAHDKGILTSLPVFVLNGIGYYTFEKGLSMMCANRYLLYQRDLESWQSYGMTLDIAMDYSTDMLELINEIRINADDQERVLQKAEELAMVIKIRNEHEKNLNVIGAVLELNAMAFISASENPYLVDYEENAKKVLLWEKALASDGGREFLGFFWKLTSRQDQSWTELLVQSMRHQGKEESQMTEVEKAQKEYSRNVLIFELSKHKKHLTDLIQGKTGGKVAKQLRILSSYLKLKLSEQMYSTIFNTE